MLLHLGTRLFLLGGLAFQTVDLALHLTLHLPLSFLLGLDQQLRIVTCPVKPVLVFLVGSALHQAAFPFDPLIQFFSFCERFCVGFQTFVLLAVHEDGLRTLNFARYRRFCGFDGVFFDFRDFRGQKGLFRAYKGLF